MGKSEDKIKQKKHLNGTARFTIFIAALIIAVAALIVVLAVTRNSGSDTDSGEPSSVISSETNDDNGTADDTNEDNGYPADETQLSPDYQLAAPSSGDPIAIINTSVGTMKFKLFPENAPKAVKNFTTKAKDGYYNGMKFPYLDDYYLQSDGNMETIYGEGFEREFSINLHNYLGALGVCSSGAGNTSSNQFYIITHKKVADDIIEAMHGEQAQSLGLGFSDEIIEKYASFGGDPTLDGQYAVFGQMYEGLEIIDKLLTLEVDENGAPLQDIIINSIETGNY